MATTITVTDAIALLNVTQLRLGRGLRRRPLSPVDERQNTRCEVTETLVLTGRAEADVNASSLTGRHTKGAGTKKENGGWLGGVTNPEIIESSNLFRGFSDTLHCTPLRDIFKKNCTTVNRLVNI